MARALSMAISKWVLLRTEVSLLRGQMNRIISH